MSEAAVDTQGEILPGSRPAGVAHASSSSSVLSSAATTVALHRDTRVVVITVQDNPCYLAWDGPVTSSDFDEHILDQETAILVVPPGLTITNLSLIGDAGTALVRVAQKR